MAGKLTAGYNALVTTQEWSLLQIAGNLGGYTVHKTTPGMSMPIGIWVSRTFDMAGMGRFERPDEYELFRNAVNEIRAQREAYILPEILAFSSVELDSATLPGLTTATSQEPALR